VWTPKLIKDTNQLLVFDNPFHEFCRNEEQGTNHDHISLKSYKLLMHHKAMYHNVHCLGWI